MNSINTLEMNEKSWKNHGGMLTKLLLFHLLLALIIYQINAISLVFYSMVRYADYLIYILIKKYATLEIKENHGKIRGYTYKIIHISAANFPSVAHLVSF